MATNSTKSPSKFQVELTNATNGMASNTSSTLSSLPLGGTVMARADILAKLRAFLLLFTAVAQAKQAYVASVAARKAGEAAARAFLDELIAALKLALGANNLAALAAFGILPPAPRKEASPATKAIAQAKAAATRKARGTMGKKQRGAITATPQPSLQVLGPDGQPLGAATAPVASATPASPAEPASNPVAPPKS